MTAGSTWMEGNRVCAWGKDNHKYYYDSTKNDWVKTTEVNAYAGANANSNGFQSQPQSPSASQANPMPGAKRKRRKGFRLLRTIVMLLVWIVSFPIILVSMILEQFYKADGTGKQAVAGFVFIFGVALGMDNIYQLLGGDALFAIYEPNYQGWWNALLCILDPLLLLAAFPISVFLQINQGKAFHGMSPTQAMEVYNQTQFELPNKPKNVIDITQAAWRDYKEAGMRARGTLNWIIVASWIFEFVSAFHAHWFLSVTDPFSRFILFVFSFFSVFAGEIGWSVWVKCKEEKELLEQSKA